MIEIGGKLPTTLKVEKLSGVHVELSSPDGWTACLRAGDEIKFNLSIESTTPAWRLILMALLNLASFGRYRLTMTI